MNDKIADKYKIDNEPLPVHERLRENDIPSGLKNIGNSKSIFITLFSIISFFYQI